MQGMMALSEEDLQRQEEEEAVRRQRAAVADLRMKDERALIFMNLLNGVPVWQVMQAFHKASEQDVMAVFHFVRRKIQSACIDKLELPIIGETVEELRRSRSRCFALLPLLNLDKEPRYARVLNERVEVRPDGTSRNVELLQSIQPR